MMPFMGRLCLPALAFLYKTGIHSCTEEYIYQDYHNSQAVVTSDFQPAYDPEQDPMPAVKWEAA